MLPFFSLLTLASCLMILIDLLAVLTVTGLISPIGTPSIMVVCCCFAYSLAIAVSLALTDLTAKYPVRRVFENPSSTR